MIPPLLVAFGVLALAMLGLALMLMRIVRRQERLAQRLAVTQRQALLGGQLRRGEAAPGTLVGLIGRLGELLVRGMLSAKTVREVEATLSSSGFRGRQAVGIFVGAKLLLFLGLPALGFVVARLQGFQTQGLLLTMAAGAVAGLMLPEMVARHLRKKYLTAVERGIADGLDMIVICSEAGLGMEAAVQRTAREIRPAWPALGSELALTSNDLRMQSDRRTALAGMGERTGLEPLRRLGRVMIQSQQYGTPLTQAMRTLAAELRQEQLTDFEARAAKLPVLLTLPMIIFILPTVFLVVAGPAVLALLKQL